MSAKAIMLDISHWGRKRCLICELSFT